ncbi:MAG TPA: FAD-binding protein [Dehalococcoidia bacterium]|nr:FAD-binding protein [Dehalococcoidia bacterium]
MPKSEIVAQLEKIAGKRNVLSTPEDMAAYSTDATWLEGKAVAIVCAESVQVVSEVMKLANHQRVPVVPRGAGTSIAAGAIPEEGGIVLDLTRMNKILEIDQVNMTATVEPGVVTAHLQEAVERVGLFYPPDPASFKQSTIGGNIGSNAGGMRGLKYGVTRDYVLGLEVVLPSGEVIHTGGKVLKMVTGYNLTQLMVGSEGTLGIVTKATLRLIPKPKSRGAVMAAFTRLDDAARVVTEVLSSGITPFTIEILDKVCMECIEAYLHIGLPVEEAEAVIFVGLDGDPQAVAQEVAEAAQICRRIGAFRVEEATNPEEAEKLWTARSVVAGAVGRAAPTMLVEDASVPRSAVVEMVRTTRELGKKYGFVIAITGHIGDGNVHPLILFDSGDPKQVELLPQLARDIATAAIELGGSPSAEHGIGVFKRDFLPLAEEPKTIELMRQIKRVFDPNNILNPSKIFPPQ